MKCILTLMTGYLYARIRVYFAEAFHLPKLLKPCRAVPLCFDYSMEYYRQGYFSQKGDVNDPEIQCVTLDSEFFMFLGIRYMFVV
jgi:hypothetical protein